MVLNTNNYLFLFLFTVWAKERSMSPHNTDIWTIFAMCPMGTFVTLSPNCKIKMARKWEFGRTYFQTLTADITIIFINIIIIIRIIICYRKQFSFTWSLSWLFSFRQRLFLVLIFNDFIYNTVICNGLASKPRPWRTSFNLRYTVIVFIYRT